MKREAIGVFEGGGIRGIALAGAAAAAIDAGVVFKRIIGTSAGALVGSLVAATFSGEELKEAVCEIDWPGLLDPTPLTRIPGIGRHLSMVRSQGVYRGDKMQETWANLLAGKGITTFADLSRSESPTDLFRVIVTDINHIRGLVFPDQLGEVGLDVESVPVAWALRASASVPFLFQPVKVTGSGHETLLADGAMAANFGLRIVDFCAGLPIVGFRFTSGSVEEQHRPINGPLSYAAAVVASGIRARESLGSLPNVEAEIIEVPSDRDPLDFSVTRAEAEEMFDEGYEAAARQLVGEDQVL